MAVTVTTPVAPEAPKKEQLYMRLIGAHRYVLGGQLYTSEVVYPVTEEQLAAYEEHRCEGKPMFAKYVKPKKIVRVVQDTGTPIAALPTTEEVVAPKEITPVGKGIEIGTAEDLKELGLDNDVTEVA